MNRRLLSQTLREYNNSGNGTGTRNGSNGNRNGNSREARMQMQMQMDPMYTGPLGTDRDFLYGFIMGYFIGFFMMFWVWMPTVSHRQKMGILIGICVHMAVNVVNKDDEIGNGGGSVGSSVGGVGGSDIYTDGDGE